jgi:hypothetical protein
MKHCVDLDVAMEETAICIVDDQRRIVREGKAASEPEAIAAFLIATGLTFKVGGWTVRPRNADLPILGRVELHDAVEDRGLAGAVGDDEHKLDLNESGMRCRSCGGDTP